MIVDAHRSNPPVYRLVDWHGEQLDGTFYEPELQKVIVPKGKTYRTESVLRWRNTRREVLVKWSGYLESFNSWIEAKTLVNYSKLRCYEILEGSLAVLECRNCLTNNRPDTLRVFRFLHCFIDHIHIIYPLCGSSDYHTHFLNYRPSQQNTRWW